MKQQWKQISAKLEAMSLRERVFIFAAVAALLLALLNTLLLEPLFAKQKHQRAQLLQQQQMIAGIQGQIAVLQQANSPDSNSPQRSQLAQLRQEIAEGDAYLQSSRERLVTPEKMAGHLRELLNRNSRLQLVSLQTLAVAPLLERQGDTGAEQTAGAQKKMPGAMTEKQVYKHGVQLSLRGNYLDLLQYLLALEKLPQQMYWAKAQLKVVEYPTSELTLTLYTLSLDKTWLQI